MGYIVYYGKCNSLKIPRERSRIGSNPITRTKKTAPVKGAVFLVRDKRIWKFLQIRARRRRSAGRRKNRKPSRRRSSRAQRRDYSLFPSFLRCRFLGSEIRGFENSFRSARGGGAARGVEGIESLPADEVPERSEGITRIKNGKNSQQFLPFCNVWTQRGGKMPPHFTFFCPLLAHKCRKSAFGSELIVICFPLA